MLYKPQRVGRSLLRLILLIFLLCTLWAGARGALAVYELAAADRQIASFETQIASGLQGGPLSASAAPNIRRAGHQTKLAQTLTDDPIYAGLASIPLLGDPLRAMRQTARAANLIVQGGVESALRAAQVIAPTLGHVHRGNLPLRALEQAAPAISQAYDAFNTANDELGSAPSTHIHALDKRLNAFKRKVAKLTDRLANANRAAMLLPDMLGGTRPHTYFVGFLNNAEARTQGGLLGSYGILVANHGQLHFVRFGSDDDLRDAKTPVVRLSSQFEQIYGGSGATTSWRESVIPADFSDVGKIWMGLVYSQIQQRFDGAIMVDPVALSYALAVAGPARLDTGEEVTSSNIVSLVESQSYARFPVRSTRTHFQSKVAEAASRHLLDSSAPGPLLVAALERAVAEGRLKVFSAQSAEESIIRATPLGGALPSAGQPLVFPVVSNVLGNKMDYYLKRAVTYSPAACGRGPRITVTLTNTGPSSGLPTEVGSQYSPADRHYGQGTDVDRLSLYVDGFSPFTSATIDGQPTYLEQGFEQGLTVLSAKQMVMKPGTSSTLVINFARSGANPDRPRFVVQPLVIPQESLLSPQRC